MVARRLPCALRRRFVDFVDFVVSSTGRPPGQTSPAQRRIDEIDDADEIDEPRTEGPRREVRPESATPDAELQDVTVIAGC